MSQENPSSKMYQRYSVAGVLVVLAGLLVYHYGYSGLRLAFIGTTGLTEDVSMTLEANPSSVLVGQQFMVDVILNTGPSRVSGTEIAITFPSQLQAASILSGNFLPVNLLPGVVSSGRADIAMGSQLQSGPALQGVTGAGVVATILFTASQSGTYEIQIDAATQVAAIGELADVLTIRSPVTVTVTDPTPVPTPDPTPTATSAPTDTPVPEPTPTPTSTPTPTPRQIPDPIIIPFNSSWKYLDDGSDQGTAWRTGTFDDSAWAIGQAQFGYGDGDERTVIRHGSSLTQRQVTAYFRKTITITSPGVFTGLVLKILKDDGAIVYINGKQVVKTNMPNKATYTTFANTDIEDVVTSHNLKSSVLVPGANIIAVEVHQSAQDGDDASFDLSLEQR